MDALVTMLNQEKKYPDVYFFYEEDSEYKYIHYDNYEYINDDALKDYVIEKALELYTGEELSNLLVTYKANEPMTGSNPLIMPMINVNKLIERKRKQ